MQIGDDSFGMLVASEDISVLLVNERRSVFSLEGCMRDLQNASTRSSACWLANHGA